MFHFKSIKSYHNFRILHLSDRLWLENVQNSAYCWKILAKMTTFWKSQNNLQYLTRFWFLGKKSHFSETIGTKGETSLSSLIPNANWNEQIRQLKPHFGLQNYQVSIPTLNFRRQTISNRKYFNQYRLENCYQLLRYQYLCSNLSNRPPNSISSLQNSLRLGHPLLKIDI